MTSLTLDIVCFALSAVVIGLYEWNVARVARSQPERSARRSHARVREQWVDMVMKDTKRDIMAIQTLRNSVMAASFMASTAALAVTGSLTFAGEAAKLSAQWHEALGILHIPGIVSIKLMFLFSTFSLAFVYFALAIRLLHHLGYLLTLSTAAEDHDALPLAKVYAVRAGELYGSGLRMFFLAMPAVAWLFDGLLLVVVTVLMTWLRLSIDHRPDLPEPAA